MNRKALFATVLLGSAVLFLLPGATAPVAVGAEPGGKAIALREGLVISSVGRYGRSATHIDAVEAQVVAGKWQAPNKGDKVTLPDGATRSWESIKAGADGSFSGRALAGGYVSFTVESDAERIMVLEAAGHAMVYVNGEPRAGDVYSHGYVRVPVLLRKGVNNLLFHVARGRLKADLVPAKAGAFFNMADVTAPDLIAEEPAHAMAAVVVVNASKAVSKDLVIRATLPGGKAVETTVPVLPGLSVRKVAFNLVGAAAKQGACEVALELLRKEADGDRSLDHTTLRLGIAKPGSTHKRTFRSGIDGSIQYYSLVPAKPGKDDPTPGLVLTLHGAAVEASGQAACYAPKTWTHVVAPTNRRPFGFDWEDWGRLDAMEVLAEAQRTLKPDLRRRYLTGHSMGGHGAWHLAVTYPDQWAAVGPSAGWISMWSYTGARRPDKPAPGRELIDRCANPSDTLSLSRNLAGMGVYVLHGDQDDNVPPGQARTMKKHLDAFHKDLAYHEQKGAGHWWGNACVDWPPMFDFFRKHTLPQPGDVREVDFRTASPAVSARCHWARIEAQIKQLALSSVRLSWDEKGRRYLGTTENVARLALDLGHVTPGKPIDVELDGQKVQVGWPKKDQRLWLERKDGNWSASSTPPPTVKNPRRYGTFKDAFRNRVIFVFGTRGAPEENAWAFAKARFDAETFWYRGNASVDVVADTEFDPSAERDRNVVLYGNADTNSAWKPLLGHSPVRVMRGKVRIDEQEERGDDLACLLIRPRQGSETASVGAVSGTGVAGMRLTDRLPVFSSGVAWPDCVVLSPDCLKHRGTGIRAAGFFGLDWSVKSGEFAFEKK
jgi:pimeloyl-ACP methyl ester carboxylesterase